MPGGPSVQAPEPLGNGFASGDKGTVGELQVPACFVKPMYPEGMHSARDASVSLWRNVVKDSEALCSVLHLMTSAESIPRPMFRAVQRQRLHQQGKATQQMLHSPSRFLTTLSAENCRALRNRMIVASSLPHGCGYGTEVR